MPLERLREHGVPWVLGSDVGAGPDLSLLDVMDAALSVHEDIAKLTAVELFHRASLGPEAVLGGRTEARQARCADRAGALVCVRPDGVRAGETRPESWLRALVADGLGETARPVQWREKLGTSPSP
jgi:hypothetical protein